MSFQHRLWSWGFKDPIKQTVDIYEYSLKVGEIMKMATMREAAKEYVPKSTKNIADLKDVSTELDIEERTFTDKDGEDFTISVVVVNDEEYRVPASVLKQLKAHISAKPKMTRFRVDKQGEGLQTSYIVIPLD